MIEALAVLPFPMTAVLNQGCRLEINGPLENRSMICRAQLTEVQKEPTKIRLTTRVGTRNENGTEDAVVALVYAVIPQKQKKPRSTEGRPKARPKMVIPAGAVKISTHKLSASAGLHYAFVSGDFNPIHWVRHRLQLHARALVTRFANTHSHKPMRPLSQVSPYARAAGFPSVILHGFAQVNSGAVLI
jgi:hypothetical protein